MDASEASLLLPATLPLRATAPPPPRSHRTHGMREKLAHFGLHSAQGQA